MIERFSYSSLESFKKCPAQFKFRYIKKIIKSHEGIESFVGKRVHEALEFLYNEKFPKNRNISEEQRNRLGFWVLGNRLVLSGNFL